MLEHLNAGGLSDGFRAVKYMSQPRNAYNFSGQKSSYLYYQAENARTAGTLPAWTSADRLGAKERTAHILEQKTIAQKAALNENGRTRFEQEIEQSLGYNGRQWNGPEGKKWDGVNQHRKPFTPWDLLDAVNPLQHLPIISGLYREITGDEIHPVMQIAGGALYGGAAGAAVSAVNTAVEYETGRSVAGNLLTLATPQPGPNTPQPSADPVTDGPPERTYRRSTSGVPAGTFLPGTAIAVTDLQAAAPIKQNPSFRAVKLTPDYSVPGAGKQG